MTKHFQRKDVDLNASWSEFKTYMEFLWSWSKSKIDLDKLLAWQKLNHLPQSKNLTHKDYLKKYLERFQKMGKQ